MFLNRFFYDIKKILIVGYLFKNFYVHIVGANAGNAGNLAGSVIAICSLVIPLKSAGFKPELSKISLKILPMAGICNTAGLAIICLNILTNLSVFAAKSLDFPFTTTFTANGASLNSPFKISIKCLLPFFLKSVLIFSL